eukprot:2030422-Pyramimonas_sp.AAC.1
MATMMQKTGVVTAINPGVLGLRRTVYTPPRQPTTSSKARLGSGRPTPLKSCARQFQLVERDLHAMPSRSRHSNRVISPTRAVIAPFADLAEGVPDLGTAPLIGLAVLGVSFVAYRAVIYSKIQYITASLLVTPSLGPFTISPPLKLVQCSKP